MAGRNEAPRDEDEGRSGIRLHRPTLDDFVFEGEETPLLLRRNVVGGIVLGFVALVVAYIAISSALGLSFDIDAEPLRDEARGVFDAVAFPIFLFIEREDDRLHDESGGEGCDFGGEKCFCVGDVVDEEKAA